MKLTFSEYYKVAVTIAYVVLGLFILLRGLAGGYNFIVDILGILFILYGAYRFAHILRYIKGKRTDHTI